MFLGSNLASQVQPPPPSQRKRDVKYDDKVQQWQDKFAPNEVDKGDLNEVSMWTGMALRAKKFRPLPIIIKSMVVLSK
jgi:hypothetical protein